MSARPSSWEDPPDDDDDEAECPEYEAGFERDDSRDDEAADRAGDRWERDRDARAP